MLQQLSEPFALNRPCRLGLGDFCFCWHACCPLGFRFELLGWIGMTKYSPKLIGGFFMLSRSVWTPTDFWRTVKRTSIYLIIIAITLGGTGYMIFCKNCWKPVGHSTHLTNCLGHHYGGGPTQYYICAKDENWIHGSCEQN